MGCIRVSIWGSKGIAIPAWICVWICSNSTPAWSGPQILVYGVLVLHIHIEQIVDPIPKDSSI